MARNTRTFSDIDLSFIPSPIAIEKFDGLGTITTSNSSTLVSGGGTSFNSSMLYSNIYYLNTFIGKVKAVNSTEYLELYSNATTTLSNSSYKVSVPADITLKYDEAAVKTSIRNLLLTSNYERQFHSEIGSQLKNLMFELADPFTKMRIEQSITQCIQNFEPRVNLISVKAKNSPDNNSVYVTVEFKIINTQTPLSVTVLLERTR